MKVQVIKNTVVDQYGSRYKHVIKSSKNKVSEVVSVNDKPLQKTVFKNGKVRIFDMGLFGQWLERVLKG